MSTHALSPDTHTTTSTAPGPAVRHLAAQLVRSPWRAVDLLDHIDTAGSFGSDDTNAALLWLGWITPHPAIIGRYSITKAGSAFRLAWRGNIRVEQGVAIRPSGADRYDVIRYESPIGEVRLDADEGGWVADGGFPVGDRLGVFSDVFEAAGEVVDYAISRRRSA